jgi:hypothetical protein
MELLYKSGYKKGKIIEDFLNKKTRKANKWLK